VKRVRVGIVGARRGASHNRVFGAHPESEVVAVCDAREERARALAESLGLASWHTELDALLSDERVNAIYIATPDHLHGEMNARALRAGKHLLSEIPMATDLERCAEIVALSEAGNLKVQMGNECRWMPYLQAVRSMAAAGDFGTFFHGEAEYLHNLRMEGWRVSEEDGSPHWRWDPGAPQTTMLGGGPHALDTLRWLMGIEQFTDVVARGTQGSIRDTPADDTTVALLSAPGGVIVRVTVSYGMWRPYCLYFSAYGSEGSFEASRETPQGEGQVFLKRVPHQTAWMELPVPLWSHPGVAAGGGHGTLEQFQGQDWIDAIVEDRLALINAREGARSCAALICALEAARSGERVEIPAF
jgi:UDP-N-acetylglucosamine 3-dehydrogenase